MLGIETYFIQFLFDYLVEIATLFLFASMFAILVDVIRVARHTYGVKGILYVFCKIKTAQALTNMFISWDEARERSGLEDVCMHDLRQSFASALVNNGLSIYEVKELLSNASITTTQRCAHLSQDRLAQATRLLRGIMAVE